MAMCVACMGQARLPILPLQVAFNPAPPLILLSSLSLHSSTNQLPTLHTPLLTRSSRAHAHTLKVALTMLLLDRGAIATALGYASIGCWLCAQLPCVSPFTCANRRHRFALITRSNPQVVITNNPRQVIKNYQLGSCDGLSFPFLVTWLFGTSGLARLSPVTTPACPTSRSHTTTTLIH